MSDNPPKWEPPQWPPFHQDYFILKHRKVIACDFNTWARWFEKNKRHRRVRVSYLGPYFISTVFLGLNHSFSNGSEIFETMVFDEREGDLSNNLYCTRCGTWREALKMHRKAKAIYKRVAKHQGGVNGLSDIHCEDC